MTSLRTLFNARTGIENDTIAPDKFDIEFGIETNENNSLRNSQDKVINKRGENLLDLCKSLNFQIANGRKIGDPFGNFTCLKWNGNSVVDYLVTSKNIFNQIPTFTIGPFLPMLSDHCPLLYSLEIPRGLEEVRRDEPLLKEAPKKFLWSNKESDKFLFNLKSANNLKKTIVY